MAGKDTDRSSGIGLPSLLITLFVGLKLGHIISWSWLWVLSPLWLPVTVVLVIALIAAMVSD